MEMVLSTLDYRGLANVSLDAIIQAEEQTYVLRMIKELMEHNATCYCSSSPLIIAGPADPPHWQKLYCQHCGKWFKWVSKPSKRTQRAHRRLATGEACQICLRCDPTVPLQIHHIIPVHLGGSDEVANRLTVCAGCHDLIHWRQRDVGNRDAMTTDRHALKPTHSVGAAQRHALEPSHGMGEPARARTGSVAVHSVGAAQRHALEPSKRQERLSDTLEGGM